MEIKVKGQKPETFIKRTFWLAWRACGGTTGMGFLQDMPGATEEDVWKNVANNGDYAFNPRKSGVSFYGDYVFGRMMKFGMEILPNGIVRVDDGPYRGDYQSFTKKYKSSKELLDAVAKDLNCTYEKVGG